MSIPVDPAAWLDQALETAGTDPDRLAAVNQGLATMRREHRDKVMTMLVLEDDYEKRLALVRGGTEWARRADAAHDRLIHHLDTLAGGVP